MARTRKRLKPESWVVYRMPMRNVPEGMTAVCSQGEWDALEQSRVVDLDDDY